jgi:uncharacterized protein YlxW (UPF0749 family)
VSERRFVPDLLTDLVRDPLDPAYAAAAARRRQRGAPPAWQRRVGRLLTALTTGLVGFLLAVAYQQVVADQPASTRTRAGLAGEVRARQAQTDELQRQAEQLREEVDRQRAATLGRDEFDQLRNLAAAAGLGRVRGGGVVVQLQDAPPQLDPVTGQPATANLGRVRDSDLQLVVNTLWDAGAEAIAVNGQRLAATSTIRRAGAAILVDFKPVASPYQVAAIGPGDLDRRYARSRGGEQLRQLARRYGLVVQVRRQRELVLPAATDPQLHYARPPGTRAPSAAPTVSGGS